MYVERIVVTEAELDTAVDVVKAIDVTQGLYPTRIYFENETNAIINVCYMTASEYTAYALDGTLSNSIPVADGGSLETKKEEMGDQIEYIVIRGTDNTHDAPMYFVISKSMNVYKVGR